MKVSKFVNSIGNILNRRTIGGTGFVTSTVESLITSERALQNPTVLSCLTVLSNAVGQASFQVDSEEQSEVIDSTLQNPNPYQNHFTFIHGIVFDMLLHGNAYVIVTRNGDRVVGLAPVDPLGVHINTDRIGYPRYTVTGIEGEFMGDQILHFRDGGSHAPKVRSRLSAAGKRIRSLDYADERIANTFKNGLDFQYVLTLNERIGSTALEEYGRQLSTIFGPGGTSRGGIAIIENGELKKLDGLRPADADLRELREDLIREIAAVYSVPPFLVGGTSDTKYNNVTARIVGMYREALSPIITNMEQTFSKNFGVSIKANRQALLLGDLPSQIAAGVAASGGPIMTVNEVRQLIMELPELDDENAIALRNGGGTSDTTDTDRRGETPTDDGNIYTLPLERQNGT